MTEEQIIAEIKWVNRRLHDSQEHAQIVRLEEKRDRLWADLAAIRAAQESK